MQFVLTSTIGKYGENIELILKLIMKTWWLKHVSGELNRRLQAYAREDYIYIWNEPNMA